MKGLKPYPKYKDSGVEWLGEIPSNWEVLRLKFISKIKYGLGEPPKQQDNGLPLVRATDIQKGKIIADNIVYVDPEDVPFSRDPVLKTDDIIVVRSGAYTGDSAIVTQEFEGAITGYDLVMRINKANPQFISYTLLSQYILNYQIDLHRLRAAQPHLNAEELGNCIFLIPSLSEQHEITSFLSHETARIDCLIDKKQRLIELLKERRSALITQAVTKGLDPNVPMKDSGIEWLGMIPIHWEVTHLKHLLDRNDGGVWGEDFNDDGTPVLRSTEINIDGSWNLEDFAIRILSPQEKQKALLKEGDLLITKSSGSELHIGKTAKVTKEIEELECCFSNFMQRLRPRKKVSPDLLFYFFNSYIAREQYNYFSQSTTGLANLSENLFGQIIFLIIPQSEQRDIAKFLDHETTRINSIIDKTTESIEKLKEYRSALISAAVTGKVDVRG